MRNTGGALNPLPIPVHTFIRSEDGPVHVGEAFAKESGIERDDFVLRLEPRDKLFASRFRFFAHFTKPNKGVHLMAIAADVFDEGLHTMEFRVGGDAQELSLSMSESPEEAVE